MRFSESTLKPGETVHAGFWRRCAAYLLDTLFVCIVETIITFVLLLAVLSVGMRSVGNVVLYYLLGIVIAWLYCAFQESSSAQATLGKRVMGIKVVDEYAERISFGRASARFFGKIVSALILYVGFMMAGWTARRQALHDLLAGTFVVFAAVEPQTLSPRARPPMPWYGWVVNLCVLVLPFAITAAITLPAYNEYAARAQLVEAIIVADAAKTAVAEFYIDKERCPTSDSEIDLSEAKSMIGPKVDHVALEPGCVIAASMADSTAVVSVLRGQRIEMTGRPNASGFLDWSCGGTVPGRYLPASCSK